MSPPPILTDERIIVRDEIDVRILIAALSLYSAHEQQEGLARTAESLRDALMVSPTGVGYSSRLAPPVKGATVPERRDLERRG